MSHLFIKDTKKVDYRVDELSVLLDIKALLKDYYIATFTAKEKELKIQFDNGQKFIINVKESR